MARDDREYWDGRYLAEAAVPAPATFVTGLEDVLPRGGRALDVAGGSGRHALWMARRGLDVTLVDLSPVALELAAREASRRGLAVATIQADLEREPLPAGPWDVVLCVAFLHRLLFPALAAALAPAGILAVEHPTRTNLTRHPRPGPAHLLEDGELPTLVRGLEVVRYEEGWDDRGRHEARLVARRPAGGQG
jgi:tellurite methyltransferase